MTGIREGIFASCHALWGRSLLKSARVVCVSRSRLGNGGCFRPFVTG
ncbi:hypothetical protein [Pasteuria penetrans]|nr:hypothetical protein [Pasteuria penetrans]